MTTPVTFSTAVKAKEKGFDKEVSAYYDLEYDPWKYSEPQLYDMARKQDWNKKDERVSVPTQSELAKWLREEKGIFVAVFINRFIMDGYYYKLYRTWNEVEYESIGKAENRPTYESAFEAGLDKALDLI